MEFTIAILLTLSLVCIHLEMVTNNNSDMQDDLQGQWNVSDPDIFNIILQVNKELLERTGNKVLQYGDILVDSSRNAMTCPEGGDTCLWPTSKDGNVYVPYALNETYNENQRRKIKKALDEIGALTCVKFYYKRRNDQNYVNVQPGPACYSSVGFGRNARILSLKNPHCVHFGVISHEFLHAIGFQHEQSRSDRDLYIRILWENISDDLKYNFNKLDTNNLGTKYDYGSVMQYGRTAFSKNGQPTMLPIPDSDIELGQMRGLSTMDVYKVNKLYKCSTCKTYTYLKVCGNSFVADVGSLTSPNYPGLYPNNADCKWLIRAKGRFKNETGHLSREAGRLRKLSPLEPYMRIPLAASDKVYVTVRDGFATAVLTQTHCDRKCPVAYFSTNLDLVAASLLTYSQTLQLPSSPAVVKCSVYTGATDRNSKGNAEVDAAIKQAALHLALLVQLGSQQHLVTKSIRAGIYSHAQELSGLRTVRESVANDMASALTEINAELLAVRTVALQIHLALDFLLGKEGGACAITGAECRIYIPDESTNITDLSKHITQEIQTLQTIDTGFSDGMEG
ncbi:astacin-like metalloendopeptidase [Hemiscyllium ocellatum]|uniref:astacin-like metalloendopeptidase n=1 Tax=Hemiscyllium ocellatum TaxID=170820 RepID=UPI002966F7CF|nr:astacin-like metalloendopeptidase [Hemiscyllium ocellatum]